MNERDGPDPTTQDDTLRDPPPEARLLGCAGPDDQRGTAAIRRELPESRLRALRALAPADATSASAEEAVAAALVAAAFAWISLLSGQEDVLIETIIPTRDRGEPGASIPLRARIDEGETFSGLLDGVSRSLRSWEGRGAAPLGPYDASALVGPAPTDAPGALSGARAIELRFSASAGSGYVWFGFLAARYPPSVRERAVGYYERILDALLLDRSARLDGCGLPERDELATLAELGSGPTEPSPPDVLTALRRATDAAPGDIAVEHGGVAMTYAELDSATTRIARRLLAAGAGKGTRVAVAMPRGLGEYCAFVAVLKADGAFVPIDTNHPRERIEAILRDADPAMLIAPPGSPQFASAAPGIRRFELGDPLAAAGDDDDAPLPVSSDAAQSAYILFTSGSTGRPKGVEIPRGALANFLHSASRILGVTGEDRFAAISTTTFDMSELDFFLPLYAGARVVIADRDTALDPPGLRRLLADRGVTTMQAPPTTWRLLVDAGWEGSPSFRVLTGGEAVSLDLANRLLERCGQAWNLYGPTETTVYSTIGRIERDADRVTIGTPIHNTRISLRNGAGRIVPTGAIGEICIAGRGLATGYFGRPDLTRERFVADRDSGDRYYRTGDLGRYLPDGRLECLGRVDHQIKVRGFRIEPADIEAQLRAEPGVTDVLVTALTRGDGDPALVAYWIGTADRDALFARAKASLPRYMVPSSYVRLDAFPTTTTGKVDRKRLPAPDAAGIAEAGPDGAAPRNDRETIMASIWRDVLRSPFAPIDKDFFSLGGTSIKAVAMRAMIQDAFGVELPLAALFLRPTITGLVEQLDGPLDPEAPVVAVLSKGSVASPWIGIMGVHLYEDLALRMPSQTLIAMHIPTRFRPGRDSFPSVTSLAAKYVGLIRSRQPRGPYYLFGLCFGGLVAFEAAAQLEEAGEEVGIVALLDTERPSARKYRALIRARSWLRLFASDPSAAMRGSARRKNRSGGNAVDAEPTELPLDGDAADAAIRGYEALGRTIRGDLLVFRATENAAVGPWIEIPPDMGWTGFAGRVECRDVAADHLGIARGAHAETVARALSAARTRRESDRAASGVAPSPPLC